MCDIISKEPVPRKERIGYMTRRLLLITGEEVTESGLALYVLGISRIWRDNAKITVELIRALFRKNGSDFSPEAKELLKKAGMLESDQNLKVEAEKVLRAMTWNFSQMSPSSGDLRNPIPWGDLLFKEMGETMRIILQTPGA
jgi:hypothetical protein